MKGECHNCLHLSMCNVVLGERSEHHDCRWTPTRYEPIQKPLDYYAQQVQETLQYAEERANVHQD